MRSYDVSIASFALGQAAMDSRTLLTQVHVYVGFSGRASPYHTLYGQSVLICTA